MTGLKLVEGKGQGELKDLDDLGEVPPLGHVPKNMHAWTIRKERHGPPDTAMQLEVVPFAVEFRALDPRAVREYVEKERAFDCAGGFRADIVRRRGCGRRSGS